MMVHTKLNIAYPKDYALSIISELRIMNLAPILFYFIFSYLIGNKMNKTKCDTVTCHMIWSQKKGVESSGTR